MQIQRAGEQAVVLTVSYSETRDCVRDVERINRYLHSHKHKAIQSIRRGLDTILIEYSPDPMFEEWLEAVQLLDIAKLEPAVTDAPQIQVPVCYDFGFDIPYLCERTGLNRTQLIDMHSSLTYEVWMIGFMPGFPYLGELPAPLRIERKKSPDLSIPAGSIAIAEEYVGIYPFDSPGGWHVIGRTPLKIVDYKREAPWTFDYGMNVRFEPVSASEFERMLQ